MKYLKYLVSIITAISISSVVSANEIKMGKADWDTGYFQVNLQTSFREDGLQSFWPNCNEASSILCCGNIWRRRFMG